MVELIHIPNEGAEIRKHYEANSARTATLENEERLNKQYPEYSKLIAIKTEIAHYLIDRFLAQT